MYQINNLLSAEENLVNLANTVYAPSSARRLALGDFTHGLPTTIVPDDGNNHSNTQLTLTGATTGNSPVSGSVVVKYKRMLLSEVRPSAAGLVTCVNADTHTTIHAIILSLFKFIASEVTFTDPVHRPEGGLSANYTVTPIANSTAYITGPYVVAVKNIDVYAPQRAPAEIFSTFVGNDSVVGRGNHPIFATHDFTLAEFGDSTKTVADAYTTYINSCIAIDNGGLRFTPTNTVIDICTEAAVYADYFYVHIIPTVGDTTSPVLSPFWLRHKRDPLMHEIGVIGATRFTAGLANQLPASVMDLTTMVPFLAEFKRVKKIPSDIMTGVSLGVTSADVKLLTVSVPPNNPIFWIGAAANVGITCNRLTPMPVNPGYLISRWRSDGVNDTNVHSPMYTTKDFSLAQYGDITLSPIAVFAKYLNDVMQIPTGSASWTATNFTIGSVYDVPPTDTQPSDNDLGWMTYIEVKPLAGAPSSISFFTAMNIDNFIDPAGTTGTHNGQPASLMDLTTMAPFYTEVARLFKLPLGLVTPQSLQVVNANQKKLTVKITARNPVIHSFSTANIVITFNR